MSAQSAHPSKNRENKMSTIEAVGSDYEYLQPLEEDEVDTKDSIIHSIASTIIGTLGGVLTRNPVTGYLEICWSSKDYEIEFGKKHFINLIEKFNGTVDHPDLPLCQKILAKLVPFSKRELNYEIVVLNNDSVLNFWSFPGGKLAITSALLDKIDRCFTDKKENDFIQYVDPRTHKVRSYENVTKEDLLAAAIGHEMIHADARHALARI